MKETKELAIGLVALAALLAESFKDGVQAADVAVIFAKIQGDAVLSAKLLEAYNGIDQVSAEVKDVTPAEVLEIVAAIIPEIQKLLIAVKK